MRFIFLLLAVSFVIVMAVCGVFLRRIKSPLARALFALDLGAIGSTLLYSIAILKLQPAVALFFNGCYYASIHWLLVLFTNFLFVLTETPTDSSFTRTFITCWGAITIGDTTSLLVNTITKHAFTISACFENGTFAYWKSDYHLAFYMHLVFCYILVAIIFYGLVKKSIQTSRFYRMRYLTEFFILLFVVLFNAVFLIAKLKLDFSILTYCFFTMSSTYFALYSVPRKIENAMLQLVSDNISNGVCCFDRDKKVIYKNNSAYDYFPQPGSITEHLDFFIEQGKSSFERRVTVSRKGVQCILDEEFQNITDTNGHILGYFIRFDDISEEVRTYNEEQFRSTHDPLTGLFNRENFFTEAEKVLHSDPNTKRCLVCTNIKNFKLLNDLYGSAFADSILKRQSELLTLTPGTDTVHGRISGDKFAMLIRQDTFNPEVAVKNTSKVSNYTENINYKLHIYIGVYEISDPYEKVQTMYDKANLAIKNISDDYAISIAYYNADLLASLMEDKRVVAHFEAALDENQFKMFLQPQIRTSDEKCLGAEALVRWNHPEKGLLSPGNFVGTLEDTGFLYKLDHYIWTQAAKTLADWQKRGIENYIAVNISPKDFYYLDIYKVFTGLVEKYKIDPKKLKLEITETVLMHEPEHHNLILKKLQDFGFSIEMDDFGSGYSSLNMLKKVSVDILKIDMAFLRHTKNVERSKTILKSIIKMAKNLGMTVVTEGVEEEQQARFLKSLGCDIFQGYLYSKPISLEQYESIYLQEKK